MSDVRARLESLDVGRNILLQAPAGSGKTTVLAQRFLAALALVEEPEQVLAITFTRKAAAEMRERVLLALEGHLPETQADLPRWQALAAAVHEHAAKRGWRAAELPTRLRIQTIDSLAHEIARAMPLLGRMDAGLKVVDNTLALYAAAARNALRQASSDADYRQHADVLLRRLHNDWDRAGELLAALLASRNRWLPVLLAHRPDELADSVAASLKRIVEETLAEAIRVMTPEIVAEAAWIAAASAQHRYTAGHEAEAWSAWLRADASLAASAAELPAWQAIAALALKADGDARKQVNVGQGFPRDDKPLKERWKQWMEQLLDCTGAVQMLRTIDALPPADISAADRQALASLARLMLLAAAELKLVFREQGVVDHSEISAVARQALLDLEGPTEQSIRETLRVHHLLVDEFQDTSPEQLDLVRSLICGWDIGDERSLFLVGDPMQSIYLFRNSEVGLFLQTRARGIGAVPLEALHLTRNFRSTAQLVEWANNAFRQVFPALEDLRSSAVRFLPSEPARQASTAGPAVTVWPQADDDPLGEARDIANEILRLKALEPTSSIAVLVQTRALAEPVLHALGTAGIAVQGVDLAMLAERESVRDLVAMGQALLDAGHRAAWLAVLRAPCCGLVLADLDALCQLAEARPLIEVLTEACTSLRISADGRARLARVAPLLCDAWRERGSIDLASLIENLWYRLGGIAALPEAASMAAARQYLTALHRLQEQQGVIGGDDLQTLAASLRDRSEATAEHAVEVLTIHHAKGLEWDAVFVPGLGKQGPPDSPPLLRWLQLPAGEGSDLLLAVHSIAEGAAPDPLGRYIARLQAGRQQNEKVRLLYVAVTRARQRLYLSGHAPWRQSEGGVRPHSRSLLQLLWPAVRHHFADQQPATDHEVVQSGAVTTQWRRLPGHYTAPTTTLPGAVSLSRAAADAPSGPEFSWVGPLARAAGTVIHAEFERLAALRAGAHPDLRQRTSSCAVRLQEQGIEAAAANRTAESIVGQLEKLFADPVVKWLIAEPHREAASELRLSGIVDEQLRNVVIDRSFIDAEGTRWVIDYKTSQHAGSGMEEFLDREMERYAAQLRLYRILAGRLGPEPVRAALYFPWLRELRVYNPT